MSDKQKQIKKLEKEINDLKKELNAKRKMLNDLLDILISYDYN